MHSGLEFESLISKRVRDSRLVGLHLKSTPVSGGSEGNRRPEQESWGILWNCPEQGMSLLYLPEGQMVKHRVY